MIGQDGSESAYEDAIKKSKQDLFYELKLFVTGMTPNSVRAVRNIKKICQKHLKEGQYSLEIIDVYQHAELARGEEIVATPTLVKKSPGTVARLVGDLSNTEKVIRILSLDKKM